MDDSLIIAADGVSIATEGGATTIQGTFHICAAAGRITELSVLTNEYQEIAGGMSFVSRTLPSRYQIPQCRENGTLMMPPKPQLVEVTIAFSDFMSNIA